MAAQSTSHGQVRLEVNSGLNGLGAAADLPAVRGETMVLKIHKQDKDVKVGIDLGYSKDHRWLVIAEIHRGTLCDVFSELKPGVVYVQETAGGPLEKYFVSGGFASSTCLTALSPLPSGEKNLRASPIAACLTLGVGLGTPCVGRASSVSSCCPCAVRFPVHARALSLLC